MPSLESYEQFLTFCCFACSPAQPECKVLELALYQADCCDEPPQNYCTLCANGSQNYQASKVVPRNSGDPPVNVTCQDYATRNQYVRQGFTGYCNDTARVRSRAWCGCDGMKPVCDLTCNNGNPPSDLSKQTPVLGTTCERFVYEYSTLTQSECGNALYYVNYDAKAFCCNEPAPNTCSICPSGTKLMPNQKVRTEFYGYATCGDIQSYANYLYAGACPLFLAQLLDNPVNPSSECCVSTGGGSSSGYNSRSLADLAAILLAPALWNLISL